MKSNGKTPRRPIEREYLAALKRGGSAGNVAGHLRTRG
jgi:hypothetical protein